MVHENSLKHSTFVWTFKFILMSVKYSVFLGAKSLQPQKKPELHRIDCWWNCVNGVADLLWLGFSNAPLDLESERRPSMKSISRQLNCEIMLGVNRLYIYTGRDRVSLFDMTLKCLENISGKLFYFGPYVFISFR